MKRVRVLVSGRVQGVGFRAATRREATRLGLSGWVRNLPDGRVEAEFEGAASAVERAIAWCASGPPGAEVEACERSDAPPAGKAAVPGFAIR